MNLKTIRLTDGVNLRLLHTDKFKTNRISVYFRFPLLRETATFAAVLPGVLRRGTEKYPDMAALSARAEELYGASLSAGILKKGDTELLRFSVSFVADRFLPETVFEDITELISQFVFFPKTVNGAFDPDFTAGEKENTKSRIEGLINDKKTYAQAKCNEIMFEGDPYGISEYGYIDDLDKITPQTLYDFYKKLISESETEIFVGGSFDETDTVNRLKSAFSTLGARRPSLPETVLADIEPDIEVKNVTEVMPVTQSKLCMGFNCGITPASGDSFALRVFCTIFGGSPFSKLFNNVREKLSLAYYVFSATDSSKSCMKISSGIEADKFTAAFDEINVQLEKMKSGDFSDEEIDSAKKYLATGLGSVKDSLSALENFFLERIIEDSSDTPDSFFEKLAAISREDIIRAANTVQLDTIYFLKGDASHEI